MKIKDMPHLNEIVAKQLVPGILGKYVHGQQASFGWVTIEGGTDMSLHHHPHEQITCILEGELEMVIGGEKVVLTAGHIRVIPSDTPHSARALTDVKLIDIFSPVREEYR